MHAAENRPDQRVPIGHGRVQDPDDHGTLALQGMAVLSDPDRRSLAEIEQRLCADDPLLAILARRLEPPLRRSRPLPDRRRRLCAAAAVAVIAISGLVSLPLALLAGGFLAGGALALRAWA